MKYKMIFDVKAINRPKIKVKSVVPFSAAASIIAEVKVKAVVLCKNWKK